VRSAPSPVVAPAASGGLLGTTETLLSPVVSTVLRIVSDPIFIIDPNANILGSVLNFLPLVTQLVLPSGNTVVRGGRWSLQFHSNSLAAPTSISISTASDGTMRVKFGPDGTQFGTPVDLTIDYSGTSLDPSSPSYVRGVVPQFLYFDPKLNQWVEMASTNDPANKCVHAKLAHFSTYGLGGRAGW